MRNVGSGRLLLRVRQRGASSSVIGTLAIVGVGIGVGTAFAGSIGSEMQGTGAGIGQCIAGDRVCEAKEMNVDPGRIADFKGGPDGPVSTSWFDKAVQFGKDAIEGGAKGDFVENPSAGHVTGQILVGLTPAGVIGDIRDIAAGLTGVVNGREGAWAATGLAALGLIPLVGDGAKALIKGGKAVEATAEAAKAAKGETKVADAACPGGICTAPGNCFAAGTTVVTASGERAIETLEDGDLVLSRDPETGTTAEHRVVHRFVTPDKEVLDLGLEDGGRVEHLTVTPEHPFWSEGHGWTGAGHLELGASVQTASGHAHVVSLQTLAKRITVYNFEVEDVHTYFVGGLGTWVHNACAQDKLNALSRDQAKARYEKAFEDVYGRKPTAAELSGATDPKVKERMLANMDAPQKPSGTVGLDQGAERARLDEIASRGGPATPAPGAATSKLPETGQVLGKGESVNFDSYTRVADAAGSKVTTTAKTADLDKIESNVDALRSGKAIEPVKMSPGNPPVIESGYESWVAGQMTGKPVQVIEVPPSGAKANVPGSIGAR